MNLTIVSNLIDSCKSDSLCIRYVTMHSKCDLNFYNLIEVEQELKDPYFKYMKELGLMDYIDDLVTPEEIESGVRIDFTNRYPRSIKAESINFLNTHEIIMKLDLMATK